MAVRPPAEMRELAKACALKKWVNQRRFPHEMYFETIDLFTAALERFDPDGEVSHKQLAAMLARTIDVEDKLADYVIDNGQEIGSPERWADICMAAAWVILQTYETAVKRGEWPPS